MTIHAKSLWMNDPIPQFTSSCKQEPTSPTFYIEFLASSSGKRLFNSDERCFWLRKIDDYSYNLVIKLMGHQTTLSECTDEVQRLEIVESIINLDKKFIATLHLVDTIFSLRIYKRYVDHTPSPETIISLEQKLIRCFNSPFKALQLTEDEKKLKSSLTIWQNKTNRLTYASYPQTSLAGRTKLERAESRAKNYAKKISKLTPFNGQTVNQNFIVFKERRFRGICFSSKMPIAFVKACPTNDANELKFSTATSQLEVLMYQIAQSIGFSKLFNPTKLVSIHTSEKTYQGSLQSFLKGETLYSKIMDHTTKDIPYLNYIDALAASIIMGMSDLHAGNIMVMRGTYKLKFFDNSRNLVHSNGLFKDHEGCYRLSHRNMLLAVSQAFQILTPEAIFKIKNHIENAKNSDSFLSYLLFQAKKNFSFPLHWLDNENILVAYRERVQRLSEALPFFQSPIDLVFAADKTYAFFITLQIALYYLENHNNQTIQEEIGSDKIPTEDFMAVVFVEIFKKYPHPKELLLKTLPKMKLSCKKLHEISSEYSGWQIWIKEIVSYVDNIVSKQISHTDDELDNDNKVLWSELKRPAKLNYKDLHKEELEA